MGGGGDSINIEAYYWNIPVISTRSFLCYYDGYLVDNKLDSINRNNVC